MAPGPLDAGSAELVVGSDTAESHVYLVRAARSALARLEPGRRTAQRAAFARVGQELLERGEQVQVGSSWRRGTWPGRRYPQQCYALTLKYVRNHAPIDGMRLVHGVISHARRGAPLDHAWVELPGGVVFDAVVQTFFSGESYSRVMSTLRLDSYSLAEAERLVALHQHYGPWNVRWVPTPAQLESYFLSLDSRPGLQTDWAASLAMVKVGRNR